MSNQYPGFHTHVENGYPGEKGQKGVGGEKGRPGQDGRITEILFAFSNKTPADLFENTFPKDWDSEGHPKQTLTVRPGQSFVYTVDNSIWTHLPQANTAGWLQTGTVNGDIYTVPGDKGGPGDKGQKGDAGYKGDQGEVGEKGIAGEAASKGEKGEEGARGFRGEKGNKGDQGIAGLNGVDGDKGEKGHRGLIGFKGEPGEDGTNGSDGNDGDKGEKGEEGITPGIETVPVMIVSYDAKHDLIRNQYNLDTITKLGTGYYRFRLKDKTIGGEFGVSVVTAHVATGLPVLAFVTRQTGRIVEVKTLTFETTEIDCTINLVMYNPPG